jgi:hypothetical protein
MRNDAMPELGFYALAGGSPGPRDAVAEVALAEELVIGSAFVSERLNVKEACTIAGMGDRIGRDPRAVRVWACYATVRDDLPEEIVLSELESILPGAGQPLWSRSRPSRMKSSAYANSAASSHGPMVPPWVTARAISTT